MVHTKIEEKLNPTDPDVEVPGAVIGIFFDVHEGEVYGRSNDSDCASDDESSYDEDDRSFRNLK